jgi:hypothetical protein
MAKYWSRVSRPWVEYFSGTAWGGELSSAVRTKTYAEELDMVKDLIVESKVIAWNDVYAGILLDLPVSKTKSFSLSNEICLGDFACPIRLCSFLEVTEDAHAGETENCGLNHVGCLRQRFGEVIGSKKAAEWSSNARRE